MDIGIGVIIYKEMFSSISQRATNDSLTSCKMFYLRTSFPRCVAVQAHAFP